ncbi:MAG: hypothetical protein SO046_02300 [Actinomyces urogenitalis]|uniref:hypothetical protein n=1 Tax=Actinomyces urogenitalis TaxID=103621 RepID=UPI002A8093B9|nr:hypothetical protein [Actinomyces urogenitalis]MDY3678037.1 hypothetical protein [Actinomyces urogenitalis]
MANPRQDTRPASRDVVRSVRLSAAEAARIDARAAELGVAPSVLIRGAVIDAVEGGHVPTAIAAAIDQAQPVAVPPEVRDLRAAVNKLGGNWNQTQRMWNQQGRITLVASPDDAGASPVTVEQCRAMLAEGVALLRAVQQVKAKLAGRW